MAKKVLKKKTVKKASPQKKTSPKSKAKTSSSAKSGKVNLQSVIAKKMDLLVRREADNSVIVLNLESNRIFQIDGVAIEAWEMIDGKRKLSAISEALMKKHDWSEKETNQLVLSFCESLQKQELIDL